MANDRDDSLGHATFPAVDITDANAFEVLQEVLAGRLQVEPDARASETLLMLFNSDSDSMITRDQFCWWRLRVRGKAKSTVFRRTSPAVFSMMMFAADLKAITEPVLIRFPAGGVPMIDDYPAWTHGPTVVWIYAEPERVVLKVRAVQGEWTAPSSTPAPAGGPLEPKDLEQWTPDERPFSFHEPCPHCGTNSASCRDYETYCVCMACGRSFSV